MTDQSYADLREGLESLKRAAGELRGPEAQVAVLLAERDRLREALEQYADPNNWEKDEFGWRRIWREPGSEAPESYDGSELAFAALAQEGS